MSERDLLDASYDGNFPEVVRLVDEEHADLDYQGVSFPFFLKKPQSSFLFCV